LSKKDNKEVKSRFLVVEDEEGARMALAKILETYGHDVTAVEDGEAALAALDDGGVFDIVLTDLTLPGMSGWEVASEIRHRSPDVPVVVLSGWDIDKNDKNIAQSGVSMVLSKPVKVREMLSAVGKLLVKDR
jgi:CheY-like chemotaxis protein